MNKTIVLVITIIVIIILAGAIILTLNNVGIIGKANETVEKTNLAQVQDLATLLWADTYLAGTREQEKLEIKVTNGLQQEGIDTSYYVITVTDIGVDVATMPESWKENVTTIVDGVPIQKDL